MRDAVFLHGVAGNHHWKVAVISNVFGKRAGARRGPTLVVAASASAAARSRPAPSRRGASMASGGGELGVSNRAPHAPELGVSNSL